LLLIILDFIYESIYDLALRISVVVVKVIRMDLSFVDIVDIMNIVYHILGISRFENSTAILELQEGPLLIIKDSIHTETLAFLFF
jgi:hypothetical protein